jgi:hypothetical protein
MPETNQKDQLPELKKAARIAVGKFIKGDIKVTEEIVTEAINKLPESDRIPFINSVNKHKLELKKAAEAEELEQLKTDARKAVDDFKAGKKDATALTALTAINILPEDLRFDLIEEVNDHAKVLEDKAKEDEEAAEAERIEKEEAALKKEISGTFIMNVNHLAWGFQKRNHFYADKKPEISANIMGKYASELKVWLDAGFIKKGKYKS